MKKDKILYLDSVFTKDIHELGEDSIMIEGFASTADIDRTGDVISPSAWETGLKNYLLNPVVLAYHNHDEPVGRVIEHKVSEKGLWVKARVSSAAEDIYNLVKDGIITAFSVGFRVTDAIYDDVTDIFVIKGLELFEVSLVSVPMNQNTLFSLSKSFESEEDFKSYKMQFASDSNSAKGLDKLDNETRSTNKDIKMEENELKQLLADTAKQAAEQATSALMAAQAADRAKALEKEAAEKEFDARVKKAVADISSGDTGAERLLAEVEKRLATTEADNKKALDGLQDALKEKAAEIEAMNKSKMQFRDGSDANGVSTSDKEKAVMLSMITGKSLSETTFGKNLIEKTGAHVASATWELQVSTTLENEVRRRLVVANSLPNIMMNTNVMTIAVNPEAGLATWVTNAQFGTSDSSGATQTHALGEITLNAYKVATREYQAYEEDEDAIIATLPIIRDAMVRRLARAIDKAFLVGAGAGADPVKGIAIYDASATVAPTTAQAATVAHMLALRKDLGAWGLDPAELVYIVSTDVYYDLLDDSSSQSFQTMDKVGANATLLTGQIGTIGNTPVLVSAEFPTKAATKEGAICFAPKNFVVGNQRGLRVDSQELAVEQRKVLVASMRTGLVQTTTSLGAGVSTLRWVAP